MSRVTQKGIMGSKGLMSTGVVAVLCVCSMLYADNRDMNAPYKVLEVAQSCSDVNIYVETKVRDSIKLIAIAHEVISTNKRETYISSHHVVFRDSNKGFAWAYVNDVKDDKSFTCKIHIGFTPYAKKMDKAMEYLKNVHPDYQVKEWYFNHIQIMAIVEDPSGHLYLNVDGHERLRLFALTQTGNQYSFEQEVLSGRNSKKTETIILRRNRFQDLQFIVRGDDCPFGYANLMHRIR